MSTTFLGLEAEFTNKETARYNILPVPYDGTATWHKGADKGPEALLEASTQVELFDLETKSEPWRRGIHTIEAQFDFSTPEAMVAGVQREATAIFSHQTFPIIIGGEHSVSIGAIFTAADAYKNLTVLQLDAHADLRPDYLGSAYNHACVMARVRERVPIVQVGIRSLDKSEYDGAARQNIFFAEEIVGSLGWIERAVALCAENVYITIDLDVFDPSIMPSTGTPSPGGLDWYSVLKLLRLVFERRNCVACDVVELCPNNAPHAEMLAAKLVYKLIAYHAKKERELARNKE
jgi:agmatinase